MEDVIRQIKKGQVASVSALNDKSSIGSGRTFATVDQALGYVTSICQRLNIELTKEQRAAMCIRNSPAEVAAHGWMSDFFNTVGDQEPNTDGEIHLEPCHYIDVHKEYEMDMKAANDGSEIIGEKAFAELWIRCFP